MTDTTIDTDALIERKRLSHPDVQEYITWLESEVRTLTANRDEQTRNYSSMLLEREQGIDSLTKQLEQLHQARFVKTVDEKAWLRIGGKDVVMLPGDTIEGLWSYSTPPEDE